ncbi:MAG: hypothetical protein HKM95_09330 [Inquilinus sp.]|nr:hypothetical protein [Inquilinus sp.]
MSATPEEIGGLIETIDQLVDVMDSEVDLLSAMRASEIGSFQPTKTMLIDTYDRMVSELRGDEAGLATLPEQSRESLRESMGRLRNACRRNERALRAVTGANERLLKAVVDAVEQQKSEGAAYGKAGDKRKGRRFKPVSVRLDQQL